MIVREWSWNKISCSMIGDVLSWRLKFNYRSLSSAGRPRRLHLYIVQNVTITQETQIIFTVIIYLEYLNVKFLSLL
jgi:hypothetical protein